MISLTFYATFTLIVYANDFIVLSSIDKSVFVVANIVLKVDDYITHLIHLILVNNCSLFILLFPKSYFQTKLFILLTNLQDFLL